MKSPINIPLLKEQLKRFWVIGVVPMLVYLLAVVIPLHNVNNPWNEAAQTNMMVSILSIAHPALLILMILAPFCAAMALYPYNFSGTATATFYTFPITKRQLFWTNFLAGKILIILPVLVLSVILLVPIYFNPDFQVSANIPDGVPVYWSHVNLPLMLFPEWLAEGAVINTFGLVAGFFARMAIGVMFYFMVFLVAVSVAGNRVIAVLLSAALPFVAVAVHILALVTGTLYIFGMNDTTMQDHFLRTLVYTNPALLFQVINPAAGGVVRHNGIIEGTEGFSLISFIVVYIAIAVILLVAAYVCSLIRKHERTGDSIVFTALKNVLVFLLSMTGMIGGAIFMTIIFTNRAGWYIGAVLGFVLVYFVAQMIAEKSLNIFAQKAKPLIYFGGIMICIYAAMVLFTTFGMGFYVNRVPHTADVHGVSFQHQWNRNVTGYVTDDEIIARAIDIHNEILNHRSYLRRAQWDSMSGGLNNQSFPITYILQDGTRVYRMYTLSNAFMERNGVWGLLTEPAVLLAREPFLQNPDSVARIHISIWNQERDENINVRDIVEQERIASLIEAMRTDRLRELMGDDWQWDPYYQPVWANFEVLLHPQGHNMHVTQNTWLSVQLFRDGAVADWLRVHGYTE